MLVSSLNRPAKLMLDNLSFHRSKEVLAYCAEHGLTPLYNAIYSSEVNAIERLWAIAKREFRRECLNTVNYKNKTVIKNLVQQSIERVPASALKKHIKTC